MATLTEVAFYTRKSVKVFSGAIVAIIILRFVWGIVFDAWQSIFPPPPTPPTLAFGALPVIKFPTSSASSSADLQYTLETISGKLPTFPYTMKVYYMPKTGSSFGKDDQMRAQAKLLGFTQTPNEIGGRPNVWLFNDFSSLLRYLEYDATNAGFKLIYDYKSDLNVFNRGAFSDKVKIISDAISFYGNLGLLPTDLSVKDPIVTFYKLDGTNLAQTSSLFETDAVKVSFSRTAIIEGKTTFPIVNGDLTNTPVTILLSGSSDQNKKILEGRYFYQPISYENWATYPLVSPTDAYAELIAGKAFIASVPKDFSGKNITIRQVYLAYYDSEIPQAVFQPVVVFSDEQGFMAYVPAISRQWLKVGSSQMPSSK